MKYIKLTLRLLDVKNVSKIGRVNGKINIIEQLNPEWRDLYADICR